MLRSENGYRFSVKGPLVAVPFAVYATETLLN